MKIYKGIISKDDIVNIFEGYPSIDLFSSYILENLNINDILIIMGFLFPDFICINNQIYLHQNYLNYNKNELNRFDNSNAGKEKYINNTCITDLFFLKEDYNNKNMQLILANKILQFWKHKLQTDFKGLKFDFFVYEDGFYDEDGVCITFCQKYK